MVERGFAVLALLHQRRIDVVVSDFSMPGMNGAQLLAQVALLQPQTLRIMVSGQEINDSMREGLRKGEIHRYFEKQPGHGPLRSHIRDWLATEPGKRTGSTSGP